MSRRHSMAPVLEDLDPNRIPTPEEITQAWIQARTKAGAARLLGISRGKLVYWILIYRLTPRMFVVQDSPRID